MRMDVSLSESLCGFKRVLKTLDKRDIIIQTKPGEVIKHGAIKMVPEEGFPTHRDPFNKGRLIIVFNVQVREWAKNKTAYYSRLIFFTFFLSTKGQRMDIFLSFRADCSSFFFFFRKLMELLLKWLKLCVRMC